MTTAALFRSLFAFSAFAFLGLARTAEPEFVVIEDSMVHLRSGDQREWTSFAEQPDAKTFERQFDSQTNSVPWTLSLRQQDVKQSWEVRLNDNSLGRLVRDEMDLRTDFEIPVGAVQQGQNRLLIKQTGRPDSDDIRVGHIELHAVAPGVLRNQATIQIALTDDLDVPLPGRITIVNQQGTLIPVGANSGNGIAVREGVIYTATGNATFGIQPGNYRIFAGRGFEYSVASTQISLGEGEQAKRTLKLSREVNTDGWVACDTHVHTVTHSGHGDCAIEERMVTLAGEGIEFPIATDHNKHIDYIPIANAVGVGSRFTPVIGNEVTTKQGHFNIFPVSTGAEVPDHTQGDWGPLFEDIFSTPNVRVAILNHARDIHGGFRPFSPRHQISMTGENLDDWVQPFNAMEVINSGAVQTDPMQLFGDWCGLVNRGLSITPVGSSDSHDVARYIVGQGRTYIQSDDSDVGEINIADTVEAFLQGRVMVSYGLLTRLVVNQSHGPGDLVKPSAGDNEIVVTVEVHGPQWAQAESMELYVNGRRRPAKQVQMGALSETSLQGTATWRIPRTELKHDVWLTAVGHGKGIAAPYWQTAKPYQPDSANFVPYTFGATGPVRIDVDGDGRFSSPLEYAKRIVNETIPAGDHSEADLMKLVDRLSHFDASVTQQALSLLQAVSVDLAKAQDVAKDNVRKTIADYRQAWRVSVAARLEQVE
jgi:hypothetical protein